MQPPSMKYNPAFLTDEALIASFVARQAELARILEVIRDNTDGSNQHLLVIGPRGIGKTTLVLRTAAEVRRDLELRAAWYPVTFGEETYQVTTPGEFWLEALFQVGEQTGEARWKRAHEELLAERDDGRLRLRAIAQLMDFADEQGKRLLLVVENLNMLLGGQISSDDVWVLRQALMNEPRIMLLATATSRFEEIDDYNSALYELFRIIELDPLDQGEAQAIWAANTGQDVPAIQMRPLQILTGGNPRLIRILSEFAAKTSFHSLMSDLTRLVDEHTEYFKHHLDSLPPQERKVFVTLADLWDPSTARRVAETARLDVNMASALLKRLADRGAVTLPYKRGRAQYYQVAERMYNIYHLMRRRGPTASRVHAVVRFMVSLYRGDALVKTTRSLVDEAVQFTAGARQEHFVAYEAIMQQVREPQLTRQIIDATRSTIEGMPDAPASVLELIQRHCQPELSDDVESAAALAKLRIEDTNEPETLLRMAEVIAEDSARLDEADAAFQKTLVLAPKNAAGWNRYADFLYLRVRDPERALSAINRSIEINPRAATAWVRHGVALGDLGRTAEALESYERAVEIDPQHAAAWYNRGIALSGLGRTAEALESYERAVEIDPRHAAAWNNRAVALGLLGHTAEALESCGRAVEIDPQHAPGWNNRGIALSGLGRTAEALESCERAVEIDPQNAVAWNSRAIALSNLGRTAEALESFERAVEINPQHAAAWYNRGVALGDLGRTAEALESYERAVGIDPQQSRAWENLGMTLIDLGRSEEALRSYDRAVEIDPRRPSLRIWRALSLRKLCRVEEAERDLRAVLQIDAQNVGVLSELIDLLLDEGRFEDAELAAKEHLGESPSADLLNAVGWTFFARRYQRGYGEAEGWVRRAVSIAPDNGEIRHTLASLLGAQGKWEDALAEAAEFLKHETMLAAGLNETISFFIDAVAAGYEDRVLDVIRATGREEALEPLVVAVQYLAGAEVDVAREISEVARDVVRRVEARRAEIQKEASSERA